MPRSPIAEFIARLECAQTAEEKHDAFMAEAIETGGFYAIPREQAAPASYMVEIHLHGIFGYGRSEAEAQRSWARTAQRHLETLETQDRAA
ncbi:hypothetical protein [Aquimixticola soesokkakensis]|nr:hypothetical protein [Aquimixticola soesokkakensis]